MKIARAVSFSYFALAGVVLIAAAGAAIVFGFSRNEKQENLIRPSGQQVVSSVSNIAVISEADGRNSFLFRKDLASGKNVRLTQASSGIETEASISSDGKLVVYTYANPAGSKSSVWVTEIDGRGSHRVSGQEQDALHPVFAPDNSKIFYAVSGFNGNYSPVVRPAKHDWDVFVAPVQSSPIAPTQITQSFFYDLQSLDVTSDSVNSNGARILISTSGCPIGALIEEFNVGASGRNKIFQPHVPREPSAGPSFGEARFLNNGMDILFLAASEVPSSNYDYNLYSMSDVTGGEIKQLTHLKGMTSELTVLPGNRASFVNGGTRYVLDMTTEEVKPL